MRWDISRCGETKRIAEEDLAAVREDKEDEREREMEEGREKTERKRKSGF